MSSMNQYLHTEPGGKENRTKKGFSLKDSSDRVCAFAELKKLITCT